MEGGGGKGATGTRTARERERQATKSDFTMKEGNKSARLGFGWALYNYGGERRG